MPKSCRCCRQKGARLRASNCDDRALFPPPGWSATPPHPPRPGMPACPEPSRSSRLLRHEERTGVLGPINGDGGSPRRPPVWLHSLN
eukprot:scaffold86281_cov27-Tisochrysis_lutea.AAC.6